VSPFTRRLAFATRDTSQRDAFPSFGIPQAEPSGARAERGCQFGCYGRAEPSYPAIGRRKSPANGLKLRGEASPLRRQGVRVSGKPVGTLGKRSFRSLILRSVPLLGGRGWTGQGGTRP